MRRAARRDANEPVVMEVFQAAGCAILDKLNEDGRPDKVAFKYAGNGLWRVWLVEVKQPKGKLRVQQQTFQAKWRGPQVHVVRTVDEAAQLLANR